MKTTGMVTSRGGGTLRQPTLKYERLFLGSSSSLGLNHCFEGGDRAHINLVQVLVLCVAQLFFLVVSI